MNAGHLFQWAAMSMLQGVGLLASGDRPPQAQANFARHFVPVGNYIKSSIEQVAPEVKSKAPPGQLELELPK